MTWWQLTLIGVGAALATYAGLVVTLVLAGRREYARAVATFVPDCIVLFQRLLRDPRLSLRYKVLVGALVPYLALPFDLVPDFIPVAGYLDDAIIVALVLRVVVRGSGPALLREHWPGPDAALRALLKLTGSACGRGTA